MADWPIFGGGPSVGLSDYLTNAYPILVTAGDPANTAGAYSELVPSAPYSGVAFFQVFTTFSTDACALVSFAIGTAGSEVVFAENILVNADANLGGKGFNIPTVCVQKGQRISAKAQATIASSTVRIQTIIVPVGFFVQGPSVCDTFGDTTADSGGTEVDPGTTANTFGSFVQFSASSPRSYRMIFAAVGNQNDFTRTNSAWWKVDVGITSSPAGNVIYSFTTTSQSASGDIMAPISQLCHCNIPKGSEIHVRAKSNKDDADSRKIDVVLYLFA